MSRPALVLIIAALLLGGCARLPRVADYSGDSGEPVELTNVPYFPQQDHYCGPATLAEMLSASGVPASPAQIVPMVYVPQRQGSLAIELVAATRQHGRVGYVLRPELTDVLAEVRAGHPVLVLQNLGLDALADWHYAVVVGFDPRRDTLTLRSGSEPTLRWSSARFLAAWGSARWAMVVVRPDEIPPTATLADWLATTQAFEALHRPDTAEVAYTAATRRWSEDPRAWEALGNARYAQHDLAGARAAFERAVRLAPTESGAYNNLAQVEAEQGCTDDAQVSIAHALAIEPDHERRAIFQRTAHDITSSPHPGGCSVQ